MSTAPKPSLPSSSFAPGSVVVLKREHIESSAPSWWYHAVVITVLGDYVVCRHLDGSQAEYPVSIIGNPDAVIGGE